MAGHFIPSIEFLMSKLVSVGFDVPNGKAKIWYSYSRPIGVGLAVKGRPEDVVLAPSLWSKTTAKHINYLKENVQQFYQVGTLDEFYERAWKLLFWQTIQ